MSKWNEASTKPATSGVYETRAGNHQLVEPMYQLWTGTHWDYPTNSVENAKKPFGKSRIQDVQWREVQS